MSKSAKGNHPADLGVLPGEISYFWSPRRPRHIRVNQPVGGPSLTQQEFKDQCDINHQIALFTRAGRPLPVYGSEASMDQVQDLNATYVDAINAVREVDEAFSKLDFRVRDRFRNSPLEMAQFLADPANRQEAYDLGLVTVPPKSPVPPAEPLKEPVKAPAPDGAQGKGS